MCNWLQTLSQTGRTRVSVLVDWATFAAPMSLPHAILTALVERPSTGAVLARRFDRAIGYLWQATHQQIYRELARLEEAGWVASEPVESGPGMQRMYRVLPAGREELRQWVASELPATVLRDTFMVRLRAEAAIGHSGLDAQIRQRMAQDDDTLRLFREIEARDFATPGPGREQRLQHLILKTGIQSVEQRLQLYREALDILALPADPSPSTDGA